MNFTSTQKTPNSTLVTTHFIIGGFSLVLVAVILMLNPTALLQHFFNPILLATTHLLVLGFITTICLGALYQLLPVLLDVQLFSEKTGFITLILLTVGWMLLVISFWNFNFQSYYYYWAAFFIFVAISLFKINIYLTTQKNTTKSIEKRFILTAIGWLFITVLAGILFGLNLSYNFIPISHLELLKLHAHIGIFGWITQLIMGVGSRLFPMFLLSYEADKKKLKVAYITLNSGLLIGALSLLFSLNLVVLPAIILVVFALLLFLKFIFETYTQRIKKTNDVGMKKSLVAISFLLIPLVILIISIFDLSNSSASIYGFTLLFGFISMLIMGLTYKTLPFIVWLKNYRNFVGKTTTPLPKDLYSEKLLKYQFILIILSMLLIIVGIHLSSLSFVQIGTVLLFLSTVIYLINMLKIVLHQTKIT